MNIRMQSRTPVLLPTVLLRNKKTGDEIIAGSFSEESYPGFELVEVLAPGQMPTRSTQSPAKTALTAVPMAQEGSGADEDVDGPPLPIVESAPRQKRSGAPRRASG